MKTCIHINELIPSNGALLQNKIVAEMLKKLSEFVESKAEEQCMQKYSCNNGNDFLQY
jgi:hypothetical protein